MGCFDAHGRKQRKKKGTVKTCSWGASGTCRTQTRLAGSETCRTSGLRLQSAGEIIILETGVNSSLQVAGGRGRAFILCEAGLGSRA